MSSIANFKELLKTIPTVYLESVVIDNSYNVYESERSSELTFRRKKEIFESRINSIKEMLFNPVNNCISPIANFPTIVIEWLTGSKIGTPKDPSWDHIVHLIQQEIDSR